MASENEIMPAVLRQLLVTKLDFQRLADDTGLSSAEAARSRWRRLKAKLEGCASTDTSPSKTSVTLPNLQRELVVKNGNGKRDRCMDKDEIGDDDTEKNEKSDIHQEKRGRGRRKGLWSERRGRLRYGRKSATRRHVNTSALTK
ncbi:hypothetical protein BKA61DRAFT_658303 [Leptodontidium sp. MPI-SDFR-AT-0119]|nr:hypothetical protein BKA61DRAFT_658303 [Leptodontidium sp. MPI-SDFR-AT-0119]